MPFIGLKTSKKLTPSQKLEVKEGFGRAIELIPGKLEEKMMMSIEDGENMFFRGIEKEAFAYVQVHLKDKAEFEDKAKMTEAIYNTLEEKAGIDKNDCYLSILEFDEWGSRGVLKK